MCVLYFAPHEDKRPPLKELIAGEDCNGDGGGLAYFNEDNLPAWKKGLTAKEIWEELKLIKGPVMIHFRLASGGMGKTIPELSHPFPIEQNARVDLEGVSQNGLLFQNGTWHSWKSKGILDALQSGAGKVRLPDRAPWSDTRALAWLASVYGPEWLDFADHSSKLGVVLANPKRMYIIGESWTHVEEKDGDWWQSSSTCGTASKKWQGYDYHSEYEAAKNDLPAEKKTKEEKKLPKRMTAKNLIKAAELCKITPTGAAHFSDAELELALETLSSAQVPILGLDA